MNKSIISLFVLAALLQVSLGATATTVCPKVVCGKLTDQCFKFDSTTNEVTLQTCPSDHTCDVPITQIGAQTPDLDTATCQKNPAPPSGGSGTKPKVLAGEKCSTKTDCYSDACSGTCTGVAKGKACVAYSATLSDTDKGKLCGKGMYCDSSNVCAEGIAEGKDCSSTVSCAGRAMCTAGKCQGVGSIAKTKTCSSSFQCAAGLYCDTDLTCKEAPTSNYGLKCSKASDCTGGTSCTCSSTWANTSGEGICTSVTGNPDYYNTLRSAYKDDSFSGPLYMKLTGGAGTPTPKKPFGDLGSLPTGSCYKDFANGALYKEMDHGSSSSMVALSGFIVALFFALF